MTHSQQIKSNLWKLYATRSIRSFSIMIPVMALFFIERGLSQGEIFLLQAMFGVVYLVLEIPSGYFADRFGKRRALVLGSVLWVVGELFFINAYGFWELFLAELILGVAISLFSGADEALLHGTLRDLKVTKTYLKRSRSLYVWYITAEAVGALLGGMLFVVFPFTTMFLIQASISAIAIPIAWSLVEPKARPERQLEKTWPEVRRILQRPGTVGLFLLYGALSSATLMMVWFAQPYLQQIGVPKEYFGLVWFGLLGLSAGSSFTLDWVRKYLSQQTILLILVLMPITMYGLLALLPTGLWMIGIMGLSWVFRSWHAVYLRALIQETAENVNRATTLSVAGAFMKAIFLFSPLLGSVEWWSGYENAFLVSGIAMSGIAFLGYRLMR